MNIKKIIKILCTACLICSTLTPLAYANEDNNCAPAYHQYCTGCHSFERICKTLATKDAMAWKQTVGRMAGYAGYDAKEQQAVLDCLTITKPGNPALCR